MGPKYAHFATTFADYAPTMDYGNRYGVLPMGPKCAQSAPTMRPLCAHYVHKLFRS